MPESPISGTLTKMLALHATRQPKKLALTFLRDGEQDALSWSYGDLDRHARKVGAFLDAATKPGDRVLLLYPSGLEYVAALFGCFYSGRVAVPVFPPDPTRLNASLERLRQTIADCEPACVLTDMGFIELAKPFCIANAMLTDVRWQATDSLDIDLGLNWREVATVSNGLALLQYTSGSTARPRGVMLTHRNLLANEKMIEVGAGHQGSTRFVTWLPLYHDMGLIGTILNPLYLGSDTVFMSPLLFLERPMRWLEAITRYRGNTSGGPNFAYEVCVSRSTPEERRLLDLSTWHVAFNGAEPVKSQTLGRFAAAFAEAGFDPKAFYPCYGLAEASLIVSGGPPQRPLVSVEVDAAALTEDRVKLANKGSLSRTIVSCGRLIGEEQLRIVNPQSGSALPDGLVGEIWVAGDHVSSGYWRQPSADSELFGWLVEEGRQTRYLRTGDLGFLDRGELFVTGRIKELCILRGKNFYPEDIEECAERSHAAIRRGRTVACVIDSAEQENLVVICERSERDEETHSHDIARAIRKSVATEHQQTVYAVILVAPRTIPLTSSGKRQRLLCQRLLVTGQFSTLGQVLFADRLDLVPSAPGTPHSTETSTKATV